MASWRRDNHRTGAFTMYGCVHIATQMFLRQCIDDIGLVVEYSPATGETRVRFPDGVFIFVLVFRAKREARDPPNPNSSGLFFGPDLGPPPPPAPGSLGATWARAGARTTRFSAVDLPRPRGGPGRPGSFSRGIRRARPRLRPRVRPCHRCRPPVPARRRSPSRLAASARGGPHRRR